MNDPEWHALPIPADVRARYDAEVARIRDVARLPWQPGLLPERDATAIVMKLRRRIAGDLAMADGGGPGLRERIARAIEAEADELERAMRARKDEVEYWRCGATEDRIEGLRGAAGIARGVDVDQVDQQGEVDGRRILSWEEYNR